MSPEGRPAWPRGRRVTLASGAFSGLLLLLLMVLLVLVLLVLSSFRVLCWKFRLYSGDGSLSCSSPHPTLRSQGSHLCVSPVLRIHQDERMK